jgi:hypothetical protein
LAAVAETTSEEEVSSEGSQQTARTSENKCGCPKSGRRPALGREL